MALEKVIEKIAEPIATKVAGKLASGSAHSLEEKLARAAAEAADPTALKSVADEGVETATKEATKRGIGGKTADWMKNNKLKTAGIGTAGLLGGAALFDHGRTMQPISDGPVQIEKTVTDITNAAHQATDNLASQAADGIVEFDPEVIEDFIVALKRSSDEMNAAPKMMATALEALCNSMSRDELGNPTRDGQPSPVYHDLVQVLGEMNTKFGELVTACQTQLRGDAARLEKILAAQLEIQKTSSDQMQNVDSTLV